jgi:hypothetical protein
MIACQSCGFVNPLGTRFCRQCGTKIDVQYAQVQSAVQATRLDNREQRWLRGGRKALTLAVFLLVCAFGARWMLMPAMPPAYLPAFRPDHLIPETLMQPPAAAPQAASRMAWRASIAPELMAEVQSSVAQIGTLQAARMKAQKADGSFDGPDAIAATALAALALQSYPCGDDVVAAATRARTWLTAQLSTLGRVDPLPRTLAIYALVDADDIQDTVLKPLLPYLADGRAATWQALTLLEIAPALRPADNSQLVDALTTPEGMALLSLIGGKAAHGDATDPFAGACTATDGEARLVWAITAWLFAASPHNYLTTMKSWSEATPAPLPAPLAVAGPTAPAALALLCLTAAARQPVIQPQ